MPGGPRGPVPKRSAVRRRRNLESVPDVVTLPVTQELAGTPLADDSWHPIVKSLYDSLARSGQAQFFEPSDWAFALLTCELLSRGLCAEKMPAMLISSCMSDLSRLGVTEGDRRRMRVELQRDIKDEGEDAKVLKLNKYKHAAGVKT